LAGGAKIKEFLGDGTDGAVWATDRSTAVKVFKLARGYFNERDAYMRLAEYEVTEQLAGFWVPKMNGFDDDLRVVEMDLMQRPPYIIDFAKVRIDRPPDFPQDVLDHIEEKGQDQFQDNWPAVRMLMEALESFQIYYVDPSPYNIVFPDEG